MLHSNGMYHRYIIDAVYDAEWLIEIGVSSTVTIQDDAGLVATVRSEGIEWYDDNRYAEYVEMLKE